MFAVPGWSVPSTFLKAQSSEHSFPDNTRPPIEAEGPAPKSSKKRKRNHAKPNQQEVNAANLVGFWESVIEGKHAVPHKGRHIKGQKTVQNPGIELAKKDGSDKVDADQGKGKRVAKHVVKKAPLSQSSKIASNMALEEMPGKPLDAQPAENQTERGDKTKRARLLADGLKAQPLNPGSSGAGVVKSPAGPATLSKSAPKLTALQASMRQKLISARFRHLNQTLYTTPSDRSMTLFQDNPEMFTEYHEGFRRQVDVWPENPVEGYVAQIQKRGGLRTQHRSDNPERGLGTGLTPLPRTKGCCHIADLGCGDAVISTTLQSSLKKLNLKIHSFDLQSPSPLVTKADIADLPLGDGTVDIAIFCLALMGTNWIDFVEEAYRILRWKGELWVAEIKSRFSRGARPNNKVVSHSVGNKKRLTKPTKEERKFEEVADDATASVEVDGAEDTGTETDIEAFVQVLKRRGFVVKGDRSAVDFSNKMFVKMCFIKDLTPIKGKCVPMPKGMEQMGLDTWKKKPKGSSDEEHHVSGEAAVLKPCVYKLR